MRTRTSTGGVIQTTAKSPYSSIGGNWLILQRAILGLCLVSAVLPAIDLSGRVTSGGRPLPGAVVTARSGTVTQSTSTGEDGTFSLQLGSPPAGTPPGAAAGAVQIEVTLFGFRPLRQTLSAPDAAKPLQLSMELATPRTQNRAAAGAQTPDWLQSLNGQGTESLNTTVAAPASAAPEGAETADSVLVQGSMQQAAADMSGFPGGPGGFGPGMGGQGPGGGPGFGGGPGGGGPGGGGGGFGGGGGGGGRGGGGGGYGGGGFGGGGGRPDFANMSPEDRQKLIAQLRARRGASGPAVFGNNTTNRAQQYRGSAFWSYSNSALDASPYALNGAPVVKPSFYNTGYGASIGGPLPLPGKLASGSFFFINYTGNRGANAHSQFGIVPTEAQRNGDFSSTLVPQTQQTVALFDPTTKAPIAGNILPAAEISSIAGGLLPFIPLPNQPGETQNYRLVSTTPQDTDALNTRINKSAHNNRFDFMLNYQRRSGYNLQPFGFKDITSGYGMNSSLAYNRTFTPHLVLTLTSRYNLNRSDTTPYFANGADISGQLGIEGASTNPLNYGPPNLSFTNFTGLSDANPTLRRVETLTESGGLRYTRGAHAFYMGFDYTRNIWDLLLEQNARGTLFFGGSATAEIGPNGYAVAGTGFDFADFLLGAVQQSTLRSGGYDTYPRSNVMDGYFQDAWNVRKNLTVNLGVRYDYAAPFTEKYGRMANLDIAPGFTAVAPVQPGQPGVPEGMVNPDYNKFSPRLGLAYRPGFKRRTVIRAGFSLFYDNTVYNRIPGWLTAQPPFAESSTFTSAAGNVLTLSDPFTGPANVTITNSYAVDKYLRTPYATTWNFSFEHELPGSLVSSVTYLGTKGTHLLDGIWPNVLSSSATGSAVISNATGFTYYEGVGNSTFNALQLRLNRRLRRDLQYTAYYQWAKAIDDATTIGGAGNTLIQNPDDIAADRGLSSFDHRQTFTFSTLATSPFGPRGLYMKRGDTFLARLLSDYSATANLTLQTGAPLTATVLGTSADISGTGAVGSTRADATGLPINAGPGPFNLLAFTVPAPGQYGTAGRGTIPGPGMISLNATFGRTIYFGESARRTLDFRLSANDVLNHVNINSWGTVVNSASYGLPVAAGSMRTLSLIVRMRF